MHPGAACENSISRFWAAHSRRPLEDFGLPGRGLFLTAVLCPCAPWKFSRITQILQGMVGLLAS